MSDVANEPMSLAAQIQWVWNWDEKCDDAPWNAEMETRYCDVEEAIRDTLINAGILVEKASHHRYEDGSPVGLWVRHPEWQDRLKGLHLSSQDTMIVSEYIEDWGGLIAIAG